MFYSRSVDIGGADHNYKAVTTFPNEKMVGKIMHKGYHPNLNEKIIIGNDVWIGQGVTIIKKHGIKIGNGVVIGSGALVNRDIPDYAIVVGRPARIIKYRFDYEIIEQLNKIKWWDFPLNVIKENWDIISRNADRKIIEKIWKIKENLDK